MEGISIETIQQLRISRMHTIGRVKRVEDSKWDFQPKGFNNNIRWHAGHIFITIEDFIRQGIPSYEPIHPEWIDLFDDGTSPAQWGDDVPSGDELLAALRGQLDRVIPFIEDKLDQDMAEPLQIGNDVLKVYSMEGLIQFLSWHEGIHAGAIDSLNKLEI